MQQTARGHGTHDDTTGAVIGMYGSGGAVLLVGVRSVSLGRPRLLLSPRPNVADERLADAVDRPKWLAAIQQIRVCCRLAAERVHRALSLLPRTVEPGDTMARTRVSASLGRCGP